MVVYIIHVHKTQRSKALKLTSTYKRKCDGICLLFSGLLRMVVYTLTYLSEIFINYFLKTGELSQLCECSTFPLFIHRFWTTRMFLFPMINRASVSVDEQVCL